MDQRIKKYTAEFIGTFFLVLIIASVIKNDGGIFGPFVIGIGLTGLIYAGYHISGAHYNPIVTIGACICRLCPWSEAPGYILSQFLASILASVVALQLFHEPTTMLQASIPYMLFSELIGAIGLVYVIFNVAAVPRTLPNSYYGLAIGGTVAALAYVFGGTSGAAFNPAVAAGLGMIEYIAPSDALYVMLFNVLGGVLASYLFRYLQSPADTVKGNQS